MGRIGRYLGVAVFVAAVASIFWVDARDTVMGSRSVLFGGRDLEPVSGAVAFAVTEPEEAAGTLQVVDAAGGEPRVLAWDVAPQWAPSWSPENTRAAFVLGSGRVLRTVGGGGQPAELTAATADGAQDHEPVWSPDGTQVAFLSDTRDGVPITSIFVVPTAGGPPRHVGPHPQEFQECVPAPNATTRCGPRPTGDADQVAWLSGDELVYAATAEQDNDPAAGYTYEAVHGLYRLALDGAPSQLLAEVDRPMDQLVPSPDGRFVLYGQANGTTHVRDLAGAQSWEIGRHIVDPSWSPDGQRLLFVAGSVYTSAADGSDRRNLTHSHISDSPDDLDPGTAAWSPDGRHIAFSVSSHLGERQRLFVANADGTGWTSIFATDGDIAWLHWLPWQP